MTKFTRIAALEKRAQSFYSPGLPYHNFNHILTVIDVAQDMLLECLNQGRTVNGEVVYLSLLFHDAGYVEDSAGKNFASKEAYSASLALSALRDVGLVGKFGGAVEAAILSTERNAKAETNEAKVVRAADLSGLMAEYNVFKNNTDNLRKEQALLCGKKISPSEWTTEVASTIQFYIDRDAELFSWIGGKYSPFAAKARKNLESLLKGF